MRRDQATDFEASLVGRVCVVDRREYDWSFDLAGGVSLAVSAPWRIVLEGRIAFARDDDGQVFGLVAPVDGEAEARKLLEGKTIVAATLDRQTADLTLQFGAATRIDVFTNSMAYEGWQATYFIDGQRWSLIAMGGGEVAFMAG